MCGLKFVAILFSLLLSIADQASDVFVALLFYFEGKYVLAGLTLAIFFLPGICLFVSEISNACLAPFTSFCKAIGLLLFSPLWSITVHLYSFYDKRYARSAFFFKTMEGFLEAGPQLVLQLSLLFLGSLTKSSHMVLEPAISHILEQDVALELTDDQQVSTTTPGPLNVFGRDYDPDVRYWFGCVHVISVLLSFVSVLTSSVMFNDVEDPSSGGVAAIPASRVAGRICCGVPFFFCTLVFRALAMAIVICYLHIWSAIVIFIIFFGNVLAGLYSGDNFARSTTYALWSLLVPAGFNQNPSSPLGYRKVSMEETISGPDEKEIERLRHRSKYFLTAHVLSSIFLVGGSFLVTLILVMTYPEYYDLNTRTIFSVDQLPLIFLPILGLSLAFSVLLVRPYHRCDCSGDEAPAGNAIV